MIHLSGPAEVIAGPGSGKTFTIIQRLLYLICQCQIDPDKILVITYTRAAAKEMSDRFLAAVSDLSGKHGTVKDCNFPYQDNTVYGKLSISGEKVHFGTFHSICWQILRQSGGKPYSLISESQKRELVQHLLKNAGLGEQITYDLISDIVNEISRSKNLTDPAENMVSDQIPFRHDKAEKKVGTLSRERFLEVKRGYESYLREQNLIDFDDMIVECLKLFCEQPAVLCRYQMQFAYILADEFQDINLPQYRLLKLVAAPQNNLFVVGDDDQAIYGFRGASPGIMKQFLTDYPQGKQLMLTENYRSGEEIVALAKRVISRNKNRFEKEFHPMQEGGMVCICCCDSRKIEENTLLQNLRNLNAAALNQSAVILRTNLEVMQYKAFLQAGRIPVAGKAAADTDFLRSFIMEDMVSFLSFVYLGNQRSHLIRFMNKPSRFLTRQALTDETVTLSQLQRYYGKNPAFMKKMEIFWNQLMLAGRLRTELSLSLFRNALGYDRYLEEKALDGKQADLWMMQAEQIQNYLADYVPGTDLKGYLREKEKRNPIQTEMVEKEGIHLITMHGAKGLEFDRVYLPDVNEGVIPGKRCTLETELEEERRLLYVAITRAKKELTIYYTKERGRMISRYLEGLIPHPPVLLPPRR